jgi:hypothetical protein
MEAAHHRLDDNGEGSVSDIEKPTVKFIEVLIRGWNPKSDKDWEVLKKVE